ncbi:MAG: ATP-binding protein [Saprospiraceae bacterium]|nr:ATP-binding protein [Saprospiraceae bacterium]
MTVFLLWHISCEAIAQGFVSDSQHNQAQKVGDEETLKGNLRRCDWLDRVGERDSSLYLLQHCLGLAAQIKKPDLIAETHLARIRHFNRYQLRDSLEKNLDPLIQFSEKNGLIKIQVEALYFKAWHWLETQRYRQSLEFCEQAVNLCRDLGDQRLIGMGQLCKGTVLRTSQNDSKVPLPYFYQALETLRHTTDTANLIRTALLISGGEDDKHKQEEMLRLAVSLSNLFTSETTRMGLLNFRSRLLPPKEALVLLEEALQIAQKLRIPNMVQHLYLQKSGRELELEHYDRALECMDLAREAFPNNLPDDGALHYYEIYKAKGDYKKAVEYNERFKQYEDERKQADMRSFTVEWETKLNVKETEWELQQRQKEIANQRTRSLLLLLVLLLALLAGSISLSAYYRQKRARKILTAQNETISQQAEELQSLEKLKSRFFANVSHELRTPLTLILGPVSSLLKHGKKTGDEHNLLQFIERNARQLQKLINEILDLSKLEDNKLELSEEPVHIFPYLKEQMAQFHSFADCDNLKFEINYHADESLILMLDKSKFEKIVHNFLSNAMNFTPQGGKVTLGIAETEDHLEISVRDTGQGIHPDDQPHIFDRFYQSKQPDAKTEGGTGIGLSLCKELAQLFGGEVWAKSKWGKGSVFYFKFPKKVVEANLGGNSKLPPKFEPTGQTWVEESPVSTTSIAKLGGNLKLPPNLMPRETTILVVEDNPDLRQYLQFLLSDYHVLTAENGQDALDCLLQTAACQLIISDLMMPVMDGFQLLEKLKSDDRWRHLPVIMLTAKVNVGAKLNALRIGVDDYLTKPFEEEELKARIKNLLRNYQERMAYFSGMGADEAPDEKNALPEKPVIAQVDSEWLKEVETVFSKTLSDRNFNLEWVASELSLSTRQFSRRLQKLIGLSPNHYLQEMRLQIAKDQLLNGKYATVKETGYAVGFRDTPYFSTLFQERFGVPPSAYLRA